MVIYYLIAAWISFAAATSVWSYLILSRMRAKLDQEHNMNTKRLDRHGAAILELKEEFLVQKDTIRILKKNLFKCLQGAHEVPSQRVHIEIPPHKRKRGRPKKHS
ncbi:hypothetical protein LCGC14_2497850 [marine sediment metagenome]|uniref:Uncharacterized protein n=1 Tax=marine sediment metagenome TaxID=412755 RepID=A0A0F9B2S9_9ZZZZ|nr:hypothetical protein [bacterium]